MTTLKEIIESNTDDLSKTLRKAFRPLSSAIDISADPQTALTILINLTDKVNLHKNLLNPDTCKAKLRDEKWWSDCLETASNRQSHNVKFPDIRTTGVIRAIPIGELPPFALSSSNLPQIDWSYSKNSNNVNRAVFLTSEFIWNGQQTCLALILKDVNHPLWANLKKLGCTKKRQTQTANYLSKIPNQVIEVELKFNYLKQIVFPDDTNSYVTLSPVASQSLQSHVYQALESQYRLTAKTWFDRATNMGCIAMTCGGAFKMIKSLPKIDKSRPHYVKAAPYWLTKSVFKSLSLYVESKQWLLTKKDFKQQLNIVIDDIKSALGIWLDQVNSDKKSASQLAEELNFELASSPFSANLAYDDKLTKLFMHIFNQLMIDSTLRHLTFDNSSNGQYLLLPCLNVRAASALNTPYSIGMPSMMAFFGFIHAFERKLSEFNSEYKVDSFAICIHSISLHKRGLSKESILKNNVNISPPAIQDEWQCDLEVSVLIKCKTYLNIPSTTLFKIMPKTLARGSVKIPNNKIETIKTYSSAKSAIDAIEQTKGNWLLLHDKKKLENINDIFEELKKDKRLFLNTIGYHLLESPKEKQLSLKGYKHAFSENILALLKVVSLSDKSNLDNIFWQYKYEQSGPSLLTRSKYATAYTPSVSSIN
ncbi:type I-F CRISPR-associated protein Csy2 [Shewanella subflava]|uniref:CRISPR-associated protein Csy2 n=1 Tax=Shewanella subflava TaxID=2986476 RepID=A0ABT3I9L2_9GAMM|nr:type I-F CRISPR-associated protein Csy2 [Shewanella subflava]MCW3172625.1 hypothetical protein [Shewanella subflava]